MKHRVLVARAVFPEVIEALSHRFEVEHNAEDRPRAPDELARRLRGRHAALTTVMDKVDAAVLEQADQLEVIANIAVGYNNIDVAAATKRGIRVTNTPGVLDDTTADLTWALLMAAARRIAEGDACVRRGEWKVAFAMQSFLGMDIHHATLGIIGMGRIGQAIARRALGFDMRVLYFVVVMVPYSPATHHLIGAAELAKMKPTAILVNTARGGVVDDAALVAALRERRIAGAGLDVFEGEPKLNTEYLALSNVALTPHIGSATRATRLKMCETAMANLTAVLEGRTPPNLVNKELA